MQCVMQMCHSESRAEISVVSTAGEDEVCAPGGRLHATREGDMPWSTWTSLLVIAFSASCLSVKLVLYSWEKQGLTIDSKSTLICRPGQLVGQGMLLACVSGNVGMSRVKFSFCPLGKKSLAIFLGGNKHRRVSQELGEAYLHI